MQPSYPALALPDLENVLERSPLTLSPETSVLESISRMSQVGGSHCDVAGAEQSSEHCPIAPGWNSCALVVEAGKLIGIFTERDVVRLTVAGLDLAGATVAEVMTAELVALHQSDAPTVMNALALMRQHNIRHLPVIADDRRLLGVVTPYSIHQVLQPVYLLKLRLVSEVMTPQVARAHQSTSVLELARQMDASSTSCVVLLENGKPVGIVTERDILQFKVLELDLARTPARAVMSTPLFLLEPSDSLWEAHQQMQQMRIRRLVVQNRAGELLGIVTQTHLLQVLDPVELYDTVELLQDQIEERSLTVEAANRSLHQEIGQRRHVEETLRQEQLNLERRVEERTAELLRTNARLQQEIQERQRAEETLRHHQQDLTDFVENAPIGMHWVAGDGRILWANQAELDLLGYTREEYIGRSIADFHADQTAIADILCRLTANETLHGYEAQLRCKNGDLRHVLIDSNVRRENGEFVHTRCFTRDITDRKRAELSLRETLKSLEFQKFALDRAAIVAITDRHGVITEVNDQFCQISKYSKAELIGQTHRIINSHHHPPEFFQDLWATITSGKTWEGEIKNRAKDGSFYWVWTTIVPTLDRDGQPLQYLAIRFDVSPLKRVEESLRESEKRFRSLSESSPIGIFQTDVNGRCTYTNARWQEISGLTAADNLGEGWIQSIYPEDREMVLDTWNRSVQEKCNYSCEYRVERSREEIRWIHSNATCIYNERNEAIGFVGTVEDISDRKQAETIILEQAALLNIATDAIAVRNLDQRVLFWNKSAERLFGWTAAEVRDRNINELLNTTPATALTQAIEAVVAKGAWQGELVKLKKDGTPTVVASRWTLVRDEQGQPKSILTVDTDITDKKLLEKQFLRAQRMESLGTLAGGIAHDLNNILTPILAAAQLLPLTLPHLDERNQRIVQMLVDSSRRGSDLVQQILSFARGMDGKRVALQVGHLLAEIVNIARQTFPKQIQIERDISTRELWTVSADATQLHQVFMNLCVNARDAMPNGGTLSISAENFLADENYVRMNVEAKVGAYVVITVSDTGSGMTPETIERIFDPFFTTKEEGKGTGLGLSTAIGIIKNHGGFINVSSEVGVGSRFQVFLPAAESEEPGQSAKASSDLMGNGELILTVDDEASIREITKISLEAFNYRVITAKDGIDALALFAEQHREIRFVLLDLMMPSLDSATIVRTLQTIDPQVQIITMSGLATHESLANRTSQNVKAFLAKPFTAQELLQTLHALKMPASE
ncbi:PAS domain S-box protein [Altericista sp. CCNU0014]|uniref:PAS domain S-box protein n=1 Tax=Altericista sp. CCNU0014 TaxID=3082949 RepID=UPI003850AC13